MSAVKKLKPGEWRRTPYADTRANDVDGDLSRLMSRYKVWPYSLVHGPGPSGRPGVACRFSLKGRDYLVAFETLLADVPEERLVRQVKRAIFHTLKSALENASVFCSAEQALFPWLAVGNNTTLFAAAQPHVERLQANGFVPLLGKE